MEGCGGVCTYIGGCVEGCGGICIHRRVCGGVWWCQHLEGCVEGCGGVYT